jgi:hypothetical protein
LQELAGARPSLEAPSDPDRDHLSTHSDEPTGGAGLTLPAPPAALIRPARSFTRAKIEIDPPTAQITVTTGPLPQVVDGVPTDLRLINSVIDKQGFMFNPTNYEPSSFSGTAWGAQPPGLTGVGASTPIESRFQVGSCRSLAFKPTFKVSTSAKTSRVQGASLHVSLSLPNQAGLGEEANVRKVMVSPPKQLPTPLKRCRRPAWKRSSRRTRPTARLPLRSQRRRSARPC